MKNDRAYIEHMLICISKIEDFAEGNKQAFLDSVLIQDAVIRNLQVMAEPSRRISSQNKDIVPDINWRDISGFRNILVNDYLGIDIGTVRGVIENRLPELKKQLNTLLEELNQKDNQ